MKKSWKRLKKGKENLKITIKMQSINKLRKFYHLKNVERACSVGKRKESSAEHSWSCLILADYFLSTMRNHNLNRLKIYELLMYHDVVEIESGDTPIHHVEERKSKEKKEQEALHLLKEKIPSELKDKFLSLFKEFEERKTSEAKFAKAIDHFDSLIHELDYKVDWKDWNEDMVRNFHGVSIQVPEIKEAFEKVIKYVRENGFFDQK